MERKRTVRDARWRVLILTLSFVLAACTGQSQSPTANGPQPTSAPAFADGPTIDPPPGALPPGVDIVVTPLSDQATPRLGITPAAPAFDVTLSDGSQPLQPVRISQQVDPTAGEYLVFLTRDSATGRWSGIAAQLTGDIATVQLDHFSWGIFAWVDSSLKQFDEQLQKFLKWRFDPPACHNKTATLNGYEVAAQASENTLYACVDPDGGRLRLSLHSNSPFTWDVFPKGGAAGEQPRPGVDGVSIVGSALFGVGAGHNFTQQTLLFPGSATSVVGDPGDITISAEARINPAYHLAYVTMAAVEMYLAVLGIDSKAVAWKNVAECASTVVTSATDGEPGPIVQAILRCTGDHLEGAAGVAIGALAALPSLLGSMILGAIAEVTGNSTVTLSVVTVRSPTPTPRSTPSPNADPATSCSVSPAMHTAIQDLPMASLPLVAQCTGGWALVSAQIEEGGDLAVLLSPQTSGYRQYASFPSSTCLSQYRAEGGPAAFASRFPPC